MTEPEQITALLQEIRDEVRTTRESYEQLHAQTMQKYNAVIESDVAHRKEMKASFARLGFGCAILFMVMLMATAAFVASVYHNKESRVKAVIASPWGGKIEITNAELAARLAEQLAGSMPNRSEKVSIVGLGEFEPRTHDGEVFCYEREVRFHSQLVALIVYPSTDGTPPGPEQCAELEQTYSRFEKQLANTLPELPPRIRKICAEYQIAMDEVTDEQIISDLVWQNIKLQNDGTIECYASNSLVSESLDIVLGFNAAMELHYVHFDG